LTLGYEHISYSLFQGKVVAAEFLFSIASRVELVKARPEVGWISSESYIKKLKEFIHARDEVLWGVSFALDAWFSFINNHPILKWCIYRSAR
jgi:hypothetical protein